MSKNTGDGELDDLFPTWFKKLQVTFSGEVPLTKEERQQVFVIPYSLFEHTIKKKIAQEANLAAINELQNLKFIGHTRKQIRDRIAELSVIQNKLEGIS